MCILINIWCLLGQRKSRVDPLLLGNPLVTMICGVSFECDVGCAHSLFSYLIYPNVSHCHWWGFLERKPKRKVFERWRSVWEWKKEAGMRRRRALLRSQAVLEQERCPESCSLEAQETPGCTYPLPVCSHREESTPPRHPEPRCPAGQGSFEKDMVMGCEQWTLRGPSGFSAGVSGRL